MVQVLSGIVIGVGALCFAIAYMWKQISTFDANLESLLGEAERGLKPGSEESDVFASHREEMRSGYQLHRKKRKRNAVWGFILLAIILGLLTVCVAHVFVGRVRPSLALLPIPLLATAAFMYLVYLLGSNECCVHESTSASDPKIWFGVILPSIPIGGDLRIVLGSLNPYPFSERWFFDTLVWLHSKRRVNVQFLSGEPKWERMNSDQFERLTKFWAQITKHGLHDNVRILPERPQLQFTLTNKLVRIEKDHPTWVEREQKENAGDASVPNHIHLFDPFLIRGFQGKFKRMWQSATPALELPSFANKVGLGD